MRDILFSLCAMLALSLGYTGLNRAGKALGAILWVILPRRRRLAIEAISRHLDLPADQARTMARKNYSHFCRSFLEIFLRSRVDCRFVHDRVTVTGQENYEAFLSDPRPKVIVTAHLGAWEIGMAVTRVLYPQLEGGAVMRSLKTRAANDLLKHLRNRPRREIIENRQGSLKALRILKRNGGVVFAVDHNCTRDAAVFLPFLKETAAVHKGPAILALRSGAVVWPLFCLRRPGERVEFFFDDPLDTRTIEGTEEEKIKAVASFYNQAVERHVKQDPEQWFWIHKRWKTRPESEGTAEN